MTAESKRLHDKLMPPGHYESVLERETASWFACTNHPKTPMEYDRYRYLEFITGVCYWEDATVNGAEDIDGTLIPGRQGDMWHGVIDIQLGCLGGWPKGTIAYIHYKVCDAGTYRIYDSNMKVTAKREDCYVPGCLDCSEYRDGYGDYVILEIDGDGMIARWKPFTPDETWELV